MPDVKKVVSLLSEIAPENIACDWDNIGLQVGDYHQEANKVLITLDITEDVLTEAVDKNCDMILAHHPLIFKDISSINNKTVIGKIIIRAIKNDIALYCAHTNLDIADGGLNDYLAQLLKLTNIRPLQTTIHNNYYKLVVFIPTSHFEKVRDAILESGAGHIGNYSHTSFAVEGRGSFKPLMDSDPHTGNRDQFNQVQEMRLETIVPEKRMNEIKQAVLDSHPYEEVAYDFYPLHRNEEEAGFGRIGSLEEEIEAEKIIQQLKLLLNIKTVSYTGSLNKTVKRIAICSGSGADFIEKACVDGADIFITGDVKYHEAQLAEESGLFLVNAGHYGTEVVVKDFLKESLTEMARKAGLKLDFIKSEVETNPWNFY